MWIGIESVLGRVASLQENDTFLRFSRFFAAVIGIFHCRVKVNFSCSSQECWLRSLWICVSSLSRFSARFCSCLVVCVSTSVIAFLIVLINICLIAWFTPCVNACVVACVRSCVSACLVECQGVSVRSHRRTVRDESSDFLLDDNQGEKVGIIIGCVLAAFLILIVLLIIIVRWDTICEKAPGWTSEWEEGLSRVLTMRSVLRFWGILCHDVCGTCGIVNWMHRFLVLHKSKFSVIAYSSSTYRIHVCTVQSSPSQGYQAKSKALLNTFSPNHEYLTRYKPRAWNTHS